MATQTKNNGNGNGNGIDKKGVASADRKGIGERNSSRASPHHPDNNNSMNNSLT